MTDYALVKFVRCESAEDEQISVNAINNWLDGFNSTTRPSERRYALKGVLAHAQRLMEYYDLVNTTPGSTYQRQETHES